MNPKRTISLFNLGLCERMFVWFPLFVEQDLVFLEDYPVCTRCFDRSASFSVMYLQTEITLKCPRFCSV